MYVKRLIIATSLCFCLSVSSNSIPGVGVYSAAMWRKANSTPFEPLPELYERWFKEISDCARIKRDFSSIQWRMVGNEKTWDFPCQTANCYAVWDTAGVIYVAGAVRTYKKLIQHEMLHHLLDRKNRAVHHPLFKKCKVDFI